MSHLRIPLAMAILAAGCGSVADAEDVATYRGTLDSSAAVKFGGPPYCEYTITLKQIELELTVSTAGDFIGGTAQDLAVEAIVPPCPNPPQPSQIHKFAFRSATPAGTATMVMMDSAASNMPLTSLAITVTPGTGGYNAAARWTRTDQQPPLAWSVPVSFPLIAK